MQNIRQSVTNVFAIAIKRSKVLGGGTSSIVQQIRWDGSDPRTSTSSENHKRIYRFVRKS